MSLRRSALPHGLSPRVRGNPDGQSAQHVRRGSIPAYAGEPDDSDGVDVGDRVYPRVCGGTPCNRYGSLPSHKPKLYLTAQQTVFLASPVLRRSRRSSCTSPDTRRPRPLSPSAPLPVFGFAAPPRLPSPARSSRLRPAPVRSTAVLDGATVVNADLISAHLNGASLAGIQIWEAILFPEGLSPKQHSFS